MSQNSTLASEFFFLGSFSSLAIANAVFFSFRRKDSKTFYFAIISLLLFIRIIITGESNLMQSIFNIPAETKFKIDIFILILLSLIATFIIREIYKMDRWRFRGIIGAYILSLTMLILWDHISFVSYGFLALNFIIAFYIISQIFTAIKSKLIIERAYTGGYMIFILTALFDLLRQLQIPNFLYWGGYLFFLMIHFVLYSVQSAKALIYAENYSAKMKEIESMKRSFLVTITYKIESPLNNIINSIHSVLHKIDSALNVNYLKTIDIVLANAIILKNYINNATDFLKLKNDDYELTYTQVDLAKAINLVLKVLTPMAIEKKLVIDNNFPENLPKAKGDLEKIQQILFNFLDNAIKFTNKGNIEINGECDGEFIEICILDSGNGFSKSELDAIIKSDDQNIQEESLSGNGLGIPAAKQLIELQGGVFRVESEVDSGSMFCFSLPVAGNDLLVVSQHVGSSDIYSEKHYILIADDDLVNVQLIQGFLADEGYEIKTAASANETLASISNKTPDLLLLDVMFPDISGYEICKLLRKEHTFVDLPILFTTAKTAKDDIVTGLLAGANDYLVKPIDKRELLARINNLLKLKNSFKEKEYLFSVQQEMNIARSIQESILPQSYPVLKGLDLHVAYLPMNAIGGDYYDYFSDSPSSIGVFMADAAGHGVPSALIASMLCILFTQHTDKISKPDVLLSIINAILASRFKNQYVTAGCVYINTAQKKLAYARAGHPALMIYRRTEDRFFYLQPEGRIMGWTSEITCEIAEFDLIIGDRIILYTDGIIECMDVAKNIFGQDRLEKEIRLLKHFNPEEMTGMLIDKLEAWNNNASFEDDMAIAVVDITE